MASSSRKTLRPSRGGRRSMQNDADLTAQNRPIDSPDRTTDHAELVDASSPIVRSDAGLESDGRGSEDASAETISSSLSSSQQQSHNDNTDRENPLFDPDYFKINPRDKPLKITLNPLPNTLAGKPLGQSIKAIAAEKRRELPAHLNGKDYSNHRPLYDMALFATYPDHQTNRLWALHIQPEANATISQIISANIETLNHVVDELAKRSAQVKQRAFQLVHLSTLPTTSRDWLRDEVAITMAGMKEHEAWDEIIALELQMSNIALERMRITSCVAKNEREMAAGKLTKEEAFNLTAAQIPAYKMRRGLLLRLAGQVYEKTGSGEFVARHGNELWDAVLN